MKYFIMFATEDLQNNLKKLLEEGVTLSDADSKNLMWDDFDKVERVIKNLPMILPFGFLVSEGTGELRVTYCFTE